MASLPPFIARDDLSDALGEDLSASDSALQAVDAACDICRALSEQDFNAVADDEVTFDGSGTDALVLPQLPVTEVSDVAVDDEALVVTDDYKLNGHGVLLRTYPGVWRKARQNVVVTYSHGYSDDLFPRDVRIVARDIAIRLFRQATQGEVSSETIGSYSVTYATGRTALQSADLTSGETRILEKYRQR